MASPSGGSAVALNVSREKTSNLPGVFEAKIWVREKWMVYNNGSKPYEQMDDLGVKTPYFWVQHPPHRIFFTSEKKDTHLEVEVIFGPLESRGSHRFP